MFVAKVTGSVVATQKVDSMVGRKLLVVEPYRIDADSRGQFKTTGRTFVAVDTVGAGEGEFVLITQGSVARAWFKDNSSNVVDALVIGIVDEPRGPQKSKKS